MPTETEWEYTARGGSKVYKYSGCNNVDELAWYSDNSYGDTHPMGTKKADDLGLFDMRDNVYELCVDWFAEYYYSNSAYENPTGSAEGTTQVFRGGLWGYEAYGMSCTLRIVNHLVYSLPHVGFRCVR